MNSSRHSSLLRKLQLLAVVSLLVAACLPETAGTPIASSSGIAVWLDQPPDGITLPLAPYTLKAHARHSSGGGIVNIAFLVSSGGAPAVTIGSAATDSTAALAYGELSWNPSAPGEYLIQAQAFTAEGYEFSAPARVCVVDQAGSGCEQEAVNLPAPTDTPQSSGAVDIKAGATPNPAYYGQCPDGPTDKLTFEAYLFGATDVLEVDLTYGWVGAGVPNTVQMTLIEPGRYGWSIDVAAEAAAALGTADGQIEYSIAVLDNSKNIIAQFGPDVVNVLYCQEDQQPIKPTDTPAPQTGKSPTPTATQPKPPTATATPTPTNTSLPATEISFTADATNLVAGQCTNLRWRVVNASAVFLNGGGVPGEATSNVCPPTTSTWTLRVIKLDNSVEERFVTINVTAPTDTPKPSDTSGPSISPSASPNPATYGSSCSNPIAGLNANVTDPSGVTSVQIWYRYESGGLIGGWQSAFVTDYGGGNYGAAVDNNFNNQAYNVLDGLNGYIRWYVLATDGASNNSDSGDQLVTLQYCIG